MEKECAELSCPLRYALSVIGGKWKLPIICLLAEGTPLRYNAIKRGAHGITNMMLSQSLKELEGCGILSRKQYNEIPPRVEYRITTEGKKLLPALVQLAEWGKSHSGQPANGKDTCEVCRASL
ncbi:helix-turn-helix transcriptional regulator [Christensenellaceae bacterium OttesenSCG-928-K19]|nr:helix-turn-helix transcriptional regulator [Christensenellaceae bacterium OttesenSCG-928-K19]